AAVRAAGGRVAAQVTGAMGHDLGRFLLPFMHWAALRLARPPAGFRSERSGLDRGRRDFQRHGRRRPGLDARAAALDVLTAGKLRIPLCNNLRAAFRKPRQDPRPAGVGGKRGAILLPTVAVAVEAAVLELDLCPPGANRGEAD